MALKIEDCVTENCVECGKIANVWTGHVLLHAQMVTAGFCSNHCSEKRQTACYGEWKKEYGITSWDIVSLRKKLRLD